MDDSHTGTTTRPTAPAATADRSILGLYVAQFFGAFNDNAFKLIAALLALRGVAQGDEGAAQFATTVAFVVFTLPLMVGSLPALALGDRVGKRDLIVWTKALEVVLMGLGTLALWWRPDGGWATLCVLAGMGLQAALFAPGKYGLLPELLPHDRLTAANGRLEAASFLAIILGTVSGGLLLKWAARLGVGEWVAGLVLVLFAVVGFAAALTLPRVAASGGGERFAGAFGGAWRTLRGDRALWLAALGSVAFWGLASLLGQDVLVYSKQVLGFGEEDAGVPYGVFAVGVGIGSLLAGRISKGKVETGLIPLGSILLALATLAMGLGVPGRAGTYLLMAALGVASGFVVVPLNALVQWRAPESRRGAIIALVNMLAFGGILAGNLGCLLLSRLGADSAAILVVAAALTLCATIWAIWLLPVALLRLCVVLLTHSLYRVRVLGAANVPERGGALLVPNHVSFLDALFVVAATDRPIRFVIDQYWYDRPLLRPLLRAAGAIPITATGGPRVVLAALRQAGKALDDGHVVCLFAEGEISRMGSTLPFRRGLQRIVKGRHVPVVPAHLDRVYGSLGSARQGRVQLWPTRVPCPVTVSFGAGLPSTTSPVEVRRAVDALAETAWRLRAQELRPLHAALVRRARMAPWRSCLLDSQRVQRPQPKVAVVADATTGEAAGALVLAGIEDRGKELTRLQALAAAVVLARRLRGSWAGQDRVGILLPPSIGGALAAFAASLSGRAAVPLNFTIGRAALQSAVQQAGLRTVVTSRALLDKATAELPSGIELLLLEDLLAPVSRGERFSAAARALLWPLGALERACGASRRVRRDDVAAVLFSSGSTGEPKGVVLTHENVHANCDAVAQLIPLDHHDRLVGVLPLFHSFGNMALWYAAQQGASIVFHHSPLDAFAVGELVARHRATILLATPTFLQLYLRRCEPGQFGSLRIVLTGAEKLTDELAEAFTDRFGIRPIQGYGATECAPVIAVSAPGYRAPGFYQAGARRGAVGRPLPGVQVHIVDPDTMVPLPVGEQGIVLVRGANVMRGYLGRDDLTAAAMHDGCYVTGDIGRLDDDGFLFLTDRRSRFSKIGGEMVPHGVVEEHLQAVSGRAERAFAVCGVPDVRKGERLMVLTTVPAAEVPAIVAQLLRGGLPALFVPRQEQFVAVDELPVLGTGKLDLRAVKERCLAAAAEVTQAIADPT